MAKSVLSVDVDDSAFNRFTANFQKYQTGLKENAGLWGKVGEGVSGVGGEINAIEGALAVIGGIMIEQLDAIKKMESGHKKITDQEERRAKITKGILGDTLKIGKSIASTTLELFKWAGISGIIGGLTGAGGLFGLDSMARNAAQTRRSSLSVGVSPGELQVSKIAFGQFIDPQSNLENISNAKSDLGKSWVWNAMGVNPNQGNLGLQESMFQRARQITTTTDPRMLAQTAQRTGLDQFYSLDELRTIKNLGKEDMDLHRKNLDAAKRDIHFGDNVARQWAQMDTTLQKAKYQIEDVFLVALKPLIPVVIDLSDRLSKWIAQIAGDGTLQKWVKTLGADIEWVANELGSPEVQGQLKDFAKNLFITVEALGKATTWILSLMPNSQKPSLANTVWKAANLAINPLGIAASLVAYMGKDPDLSTAQQIKMQKAIAPYLAARGFSAGGSAGILANIQSESGFNPLAWEHGKNHNDPKAGYGLGQWNQDRRNDYKRMFGHSMESVHDYNTALNEQIKFYIAELFGKRGKGIGNLLKSNLTSFQAGSLVSRNFEVAAGRDGREKEAGRRGFLAQKVEVHISNPAGAHVAVQASQLPSK